MANLSPTSKLAPDHTYSWWVSLAKAPKSAVQRGPVSAQDYWGTHTAASGETVQDLIDSVQRMLAKKLGLDPSHTTILQFNLKG